MNLETAIKILYGYNTYVKEFSGPWYVPYFGPETTSKKDDIWFVDLANKIIKEYPMSELCKPTGYSLNHLDKNEIPTHPLYIKIWRSDIEIIIERAKKISRNI